MELGEDEEYDEVGWGGMGIHGSFFFWSWIGDRIADIGKFWTDDAALEFVSAEYPEYVRLYERYKYPIQRADVLRYFLMHRFGSVYLDLDIAPYRRLDALLTLPAFVCETTPTGVSNDALGAMPGHPFYEFVIERLERYDRDWGSPYVTVMASTGPLFLSLVLQEYEKLQMSERGEGDVNRDWVDREVVVLQREKRVTGYGYFWNVEGRSWQGVDERFVEFWERHWGLSLVFGLAGVVGWVEGTWRVGRWVGRWVRRQRWGEQRRGRMREREMGRRGGLDVERGGDRGVRIGIKIKA